MDEVGARELESAPEGATHAQPLDHRGGYCEARERERHEPEQDEEADEDHERDEHDEPGDECRPCRRGAGGQLRGGHVRARQGGRERDQRDQLH